VLDHLEEEAAGNLGTGSTGGNRARGGGELRSVLVLYQI